MCSFFFRQDLDPYLAISFKQFPDITFDLPKKGKHNLIRRSECTSLLGRIYIHQMPAHVSFLAWQAHYDLKDPAGLAGFLIDSDIKLVRAESGSSDGSSQHSGSRRHEKKWDAKCRQDEVSNYSR